MRIVGLAVGYAFVGVVVIGFGRALALFVVPNRAAMRWRVQGDRAALRRRGRRAIMAWAIPAIVAVVVLNALLRA